MDPRLSRGFRNHLYVPVLSVVLFTDDPRCNILSGGSLPERGTSSEYSATFLLGSALFFRARGDDSPYVTGDLLLC